MSIKALRWWFWLEYVLLVVFLVPFAIIVHMPVVMWWVWHRAGHQWRLEWIVALALLLGWQLDVLHQNILGLGFLFMIGPTLLRRFLLRLHKHWQRELGNVIGFLVWLTALVGWWGWPAALWWQQVGWALLAELIIVWRKYALVQR